MSSIPPVALVFAVLPLVLLIVFGVAALWLRSTVWASICEAIAHGGFAVGLLLYTYFIIPRFKRLFFDFGMEMPAITKAMISISDLVVNYWYAFPFLILMGVTVDVLAFATFHRVPESRYVARTFSGLVTLTLLAQAAVVWYALGIAQTQLLQNVQ